MPLSIREITMAAPNVICVEILDGEISYGSLIEPVTPLPDSNTRPFSGGTQRYTNYLAAISNSGGRKVKYLTEAGDWARSEDYRPDVYLDRTAAVDYASYALTGTSRTVVGAYIRSLPYKFGMGGSHPVDAVAADGPNWIRYVQMQHLVYLELNGATALANGTVTINFPAGVALSDEVFVHHDKTTRARSIKTTQVGHRPSAIEKRGFLSLWLPGAASEGQVDFDATYGLVGADKFHLINADGTVLWTGNVTLNLTATGVEELATDPTTDYLGHGANNILNGYSGTLGRTRYASTGTPITITNVTIASPAVATTSVAHGLSNGDLIVISGSSGMTLLYSEVIKVAGVTPTTFQMTDPFGANYSTVGQTWTGGGTALAHRTHVSNRAGTNVYHLDYSAATSVSGTVRVYIPGLGVSDSFVMDEGHHFRIMRFGAAGEYHQRLGIARDGRYGYTTPVRFRHGSDGGGTTVTVYKSLLSYHWSNYSTGTFGPVAVGKANYSPWVTATTHSEAWGAWQDAGDWDSRIWDHGGGCHTLMNVYSMLPAAARQFDLGLPKSSALLDSTLYAGTDNLSDILHSAIFFVDAYRRMQTPSGAEAGGVPGGVTYSWADDAADQNSADSCPSWLNDSPVASYFPDHACTFAYAGLAAKLAKLLSEETTLSSTDRTRLVDTFTDSAELAWTWAENLYQDSGDRETYYGFMKGAGFDVTVGNYNTNMTNLQSWGVAGQARAFAAASLYRLTGDAAYKTIIDAEWGVFGWDTYGFAHSAAWEYSQASGADATIVANMKTIMYEKAFLYLNYHKAKTGYRHVKYPLSDKWGYAGGNHELSSQTLTCAHQIARAGGLSRETECLTALQAISTYLSGANQMGITYTVGMGQRGPGNALSADAFALGDYQANLPRGQTIYGSSINAGRIMTFVLMWGPSLLCMPTDAQSGLTDVNLDTFDIREHMLSPNRFQIPVHEFHINTPNALEQMEFVVTQTSIPLYSINSYLQAWDGNTVTDTVPARTRTIRLRGV